MIDIVYKNYDEYIGRTFLKIINTDYKDENGEYFIGYGESLCSLEDIPDERVGFELALDRAKRNLYWKINSYLDGKRSIKN